MTGTRVIHVRLPDSAEPTAEEIEQLQAIFDAIVGLRFGSDPAGEQIADALTADGWQVSSRLGWISEAKNGAECEQVTGTSKTDALVRLEQLVRADRVLSAP